jgi:hypothetical protein
MSAEGPWDASNPGKPMAYQAIENYGIVGNMRSIALVGMDGSIDFLFYPDFDSPTVFAAFRRAVFRFSHSLRICGSASFTCLTPIF